MSWLGRKKGKPNRGGGRGRGGSGRRGGSSGHSNKPQLGGSRKCSSKIWDDGDDFCLFEEPRLESRYFCWFRGGLAQRCWDTLGHLRYFLDVDIHRHLGLVFGHV